MIIEVLLSYNCHVKLSRSIIEILMGIDIVLVSYQVFNVYYRIYVRVSTKRDRNVSKNI
jgi:hypothetical protein